MYPKGTLAELQASQRATARMLGVGKSTINRDTVPNGTPAQKNITEYEEVIKDSVPNGTPEQENITGVEEVINEDNKNVHHYTSIQEGVHHYTKEKV